jgi:MFS family permease
MHQDDLQATSSIVRQPLAKERRSDLFAHHAEAYCTIKGEQARVREAVAFLAGQVSDEGAQQPTADTPPAPRRGRIMGLYSSIVSGGFAIGPLSLGLVGTQGWPPFMIGIVAFLLCGLIVLAVVPRLPDMPHEGGAISVGGFFALAPLLLFAVFAAAAFEQVLLSLFAVYGAALGSPEERIASLITCFIAGNAVLQILLGRVAEQFGSTRTMLFCVLAALGGCLVLSSAFNSWLVWPLLFVWGGVSFGIYTMSLIQLGERFSGQALIAGNAAFAFVWGTGGIVGSPATGLAMQLIGHQGLPSSLGLLCLILAVFLMAERRRV